MAVPTADVLRELLPPGPDEVERLNPELSNVQVGDRLRFTLQIPLLSPEYVREFLFTAFPFLGAPGSRLDLGEFLQPDLATAAFDFATGYMTIEADVIREASPGVALALVIVALVVALAALFPSVSVVLVERIRRAAQTVAHGAGGIIGSVVTGAVQGLGVSTTALLLLVGGVLFAMSPAGQAALQRMARRK